MKPRVKRGGPFNWHWTCACRGGTPSTWATWSEAFSSAWEHGLWGIAHMEDRERRADQANREHTESLARSLMHDRFND